MRPARHSGFTLMTLTVAAFMLLLESQANAEGVEEARELYLEADFPGALEAFREIFESQDLDVETAVEVHRYLAALYLITEELDDAQRHAEAAVALQPDVTAPEGAPPELEDILNEVRADQGEEPATIAIDVGEDGLGQGQSSTITARLRPAASALASRLTLWCSGDLEEAVDTEGSPPEVELEVEPNRDAHEVRCEANAETMAGAVMVEASQEFEVTEGRRRRRSGRRVWPWALGFGGGALIVGAIIAGAVVGSRPDQAFVDAPQVPSW